MRNYLCAFGRNLHVYVYITQYSYFISFLIKMCALHQKWDKFGEEFLITVGEGERYNFSYWLCFGDAPHPSFMQKKTNQTI